MPIIRLFLLLVGLTLGGCASSHHNPKDPFESFNAFDNSAIAAHNGDLTGAIGGMTVDWGGMSQMVDPWKPLGDAPTLRLVVAPAAAYPDADSGDHFGGPVVARADFALGCLQLVDLGL